MIRWIPSVVIATLVTSVMLDLCAHEFLWPRRAADGRYYQACILCGVEYEYDWRSMRRMERIDRKTPNNT